jgi:hypothetical protein
MHELGRISDDEYKIIIKELEDIIKQLGGFIRKLKNTS